MSLFFRYFLAVFLSLSLALPASAASPALPGSPALQGPIRVRDLSPFSLQRLDFQPAAALADVPNHWTLEWNISQTNTFIMSKNVGEYLQAVDHRGPFTAADRQALQALGEDYYYFDGAITVVHLTAHYALSDTLAVYTVVPLQFHGGGFLDNTIESFHGSLGLSNANRGYVTQNDYTLLLNLQGESLSLNHAPDNGFGDPVLGLRYRGLHWGNWDLVLEAAATLPLGTVEPFFANNAVDWGVQVSLQRQVGAHGLYFSLSQVWVGAADRFADSLRDHVPSFTAAYEYALDAHSSIIAQLTLSRSDFAYGPDAGLTQNKYQTSVGWRRTWEQPDSQRYLTLALTENMFTFDNTPDIGFHVGFGLAY